MRNRLLFIIAVLLSISGFDAQAQKKVNSPYARFNLGILNPPGSFRSISMGGTGIAMRDNSSIYFVNPASYSGIDTASFLFDFGLDYSLSSLNDGVSDYSSGDMNFNHLLMGFPVAKKWGVATGLTSLSNGYYYISETITSSDPGYDPVVGEVSSIHKGIGSLTNFFIGTGVDITRKLSAGANFIVTFGELTRINQNEFSDYSNSFNQRSTEDFKMSGISFDWGLQYVTELKNDYVLSAGASYTRGNNYNSTINRLTERFTVYTNMPYSPDSLVASSSQSKDSTKFPASYRIGLSIGKKDKFVAEFDYIYTDWDRALIHGFSGSTLASTSSFMFGLEYIPEKYSNTSFFKRIEYRLGAHYADNYLKINDYQIKELGVSFGLGIRLQNSYSKANIFFDYTLRKGDMARGLHDENIFSAGISLNFYDFWFIKRKYN